MPVVHIVCEAGAAIWRSLFSTDLFPEFGVNATRLEIPEVILVQSKKHQDERGFFSEVYNRTLFRDEGISNDWVQDNHAMSRQIGTLRGLHFQAPPHAQTKLIRVVHGAIFDVAVDIRAGSPWYGRWVSAELSENAWNQLLIPRGFAHGYLTLEPDTEVIYKVDDVYAPSTEGGIIWNDPDLAIDWPIKGATPIISGKDQILPPMANFQTPFNYES